MTTRLCYSVRQALNQNQPATTQVNIIIILMQMNPKLHLLFCFLPGGRGLQRELWTDGGRSVTTIISREKSDKIANHERAFLHSDFVSDFGELYNINQRFTGFFVPPTTSLYTFGVRSDDASALYLSTDSRSENLSREPIAISPGFSRNLWDYYDTQSSSPVLLEKGEYYYYAMVANQRSGPWHVALGAKVHNLSYTDPPYVGDMERQLVAISSTVVKEKHVRRDTSYTVEILNNCYTTT